MLDPLYKTQEITKYPKKNILLEGLNWFHGANLNQVQNGASVSEEFA